MVKWVKMDSTRKTSLSFPHYDQQHYCDAIMGTVASQTTSLTIVYITVYSDADQSKHQSSASLAFVWGIHRGPVNSPHKWPVTRKMFPFDDVIMNLSAAFCVYAFRCARASNLKPQMWTGNKLEEFPKLWFGGKGWLYCHGLNGFSCSKI